MQEQWNELLATALLGTEQRKCAVVEPELEWLNSIAIANPTQAHEEWVLLASAFAATYRRAGQIPPTATTTLVPAPRETKPYCSAPVATRLASALNEARTMEPLVEEMLRILAIKARIVPPALLPDLLTWAQRNKQRRAWILSVVGERGAWLAANNPEWKNSLQVDDKDVIDPAEAMQRITGQQALYDALDITEKPTNNIFSKGLNFFKGQGSSEHHRLVQLTLEKLTTLAKPDGTHYLSETEVSKIAVAVPTAALPELNKNLRQVLAKQESMPWLTTLADRLEFRQQMLEELNRE